MRPILKGDFLLVDGASYWACAYNAARDRGIIVPRSLPRSVAALSVRHGHRWAASVGVIECWPLLMFEWLVTVTPATPQLAHAAVEALLLAGKDYGRAVCARPVMVVDRRRGGLGIRKMAERLGFASRNEHLEVLEGK